MELGGNIELVGFNAVDSGSLVILKKMVGNYVRKMSGKANNFERLTLTMKNVHTDNKFEMHVKLMDNGRPLTSEVTDYNMFFTLDKVLSKVDNMLERAA